METNVFFVLLFILSCFCFSKQEVSGWGSAPKYPEHSV